MPHALAKGAHVHLCSHCGERRKNPPVRVDAPSTFHIDCPCGATESFGWHDWVYVDESFRADPTHYGARQMAVTKVIARKLGLEQAHHPERIQRAAKTEPGPTPHRPEELT